MRAVISQLRGSSGLSPLSLVGVQLSCRREYYHGHDGIGANTYLEKLERPGAGMSQFLKSAPNHFDSLAHLVSSEEINHRQTGQQRQDQTQRLCTSRLHEADKLSERAKGIRH